jgi:glycosyltransferase involved in cell wall biosynthesis
VSADGLVANLESPLPAWLPVGSGTAVFCSGICFHRHERIANLHIVVDGGRHRPTAFRMPRPDIFALLHPHGAHRSPEDPELRCFRSGFWGTVPIQARDCAGTVELAVEVRLAGGAELAAPLGRIEIVEREPAGAARRPVEPGLIAICMATFEPDIALFRRQVESLRAQTDRRWRCVISDDCSSQERWEQITEVVAGDPRFVASRSPRRRGFYGNFERALTMAPAEAELLALCDQDDVWRPEKLEVLRAALGEALLVYSDQRLVDADGRLLCDTLWKGRRNNHTDLASLLIANTITGAATLFRREVADLALPFPDAPGVQFHDHWLALVALAAGGIAYVDRPLYDYVQHRGAVFGEVAAGRRRRRLLRGGRGAYFLGYLGREVQAQALLVRCAGRLTASKRRALRRYVAAGRSPAAFAWLAARPVRALAGRNETLGSEAELVRGIVWRWLVALLATGARTPGRRPLNAGFADEGSFEQRRLHRWRARS